MDFFSDNAAGVHPAVMEAVAAATGPQAAGYDADDWSARLDARFSDLFEAPVRVFAVPSGTAANALGLSACVPPYGGVWCHADAHIHVDEAGAVPFFTGGASLLLVPGAGGKLTPEALDSAAARFRGDVHQIQPAALSLTQATECGTAYRPDEVAALSAWAHSRGLAVQMDGARFANAVAHLGCAPADVTWRAGVDLLSFGCIKNGGLSTEAIILFRPDLAQGLAIRRKRAGMMPSKGRFAAAQLLAMVDNEVWMANARAANAGARRLADAMPERLIHPVEANEVFLRLPNGAADALRAEGFGFYDWELEGPGASRFVVRWDQPPDAIEGLATALGAWA